MKRAWGNIKPGDVITWEETLCRHRGTYRKHTIQVRSRKGKNIETTHGDWIYWGERGLGGNTTQINP